MRERRSSLGDAALTLAARGTAVFPCRPRSKRPACTNGFLDASTDLAVIERWWWQMPAANIGTPTGIWCDVVDFDSRDIFDQALELHSLRGPQVRTARGAHFYVAPTGRRSMKLSPSIDFKGLGGYVLLPPSRHPSGAVYEWIERGDPREAPRWVRDLLDRQTPVTRVVRRESRPTPRSVNSLRAMADRLAQQPEGNRNHFLFWAACAAADTGATADQVAVVLTDAALRAGLDDHEISNTLKSAFGRWT